MPEFGKLRDEKDFSYWQKRILQEIIIPPGKHVLLTGMTGGGKTNLLKWMIQGFFSVRSTIPPEQWETIVWFDRGKSSEILGLIKLAPCRLLIPSGCKVEINLFDTEDPVYDIEQVTFNHPGEIWQKLDRDRINIICLQRFLADPSKFPSTIARIFKTLILESFNYNIHPENTSNKILLPRITLFVDELNNLAPSKGQGLGSRSENSAGAWIQQNIEQLRSQNIRLIGSSHGWRKIRPGIRSSFNCHVALPGAFFPASEKPKLSRFNRVFEKLESLQSIFIFEQDVFSDPVKLPWLGKGQDIGFIMYFGQMGIKRKSLMAKLEED